MEMIVREGQPADVKVRFRRKMSERDFFEFCGKNPDLRLERDSSGNILIMAPVNTKGGQFEFRAINALGNWNEESGLGQVFSSSTGFTLPNGAVRSPDVSWISNERYDALPEEEEEIFAHICPDFVIEVRSKSDSLKSVQDKMREYMDNGAQLGFLIDPIEQSAAIYRPDGSIEAFKGPELRLSGEPLLPGFVLPFSLFVK